MPIDCSTLFSLARSKLQLSVSNKDNCSLHRWVLLKNSISSSSLSPSSSANSDSLLSPTYSEEDTYNYTGSGDENTDSSGDEGYGGAVGTAHTYMFPDAGNFTNDSQPGSQTSEAQWLDSLLETLGDDDDDYFGADSDPQLTSSASTVEDEDEEDDDEFSPTPSPMSSSDDLPHIHPSPFFPFFHQSLALPAPSTPSPTITKPAADSISYLPPPHEDPLPYCDSDDVDDLAVPDTIDDTSDEESEAPQTPSLGRSTSPLSFIDAASIPLPPDRSSLRHAGFRVLFDEDSCFYPFDPLPFNRDLDLLG